MECRKCGQIKRIPDDFYRNRKTKHGYAYCCKQCSGVSRLKSSKTPAEKLASALAKYPTGKTCTICGEVKSAEADFYHTNRGTIRGMCKACDNNYATQAHRETEARKSDNPVQYCMDKAAEFRRQADVWELTALKLQKQ